MVATTMTTLSERGRALRWGAEFLDELQAIPDDLAELVSAIVQSYPAPTVIDALDDGQRIKLSSEHIQAINETYHLLRKARSLDLGIDPRVITATLCHFPEPHNRNAGFVSFPNLTARSVSQRKRRPHYGAPSWGQERARRAFSLRSKAKVQGAHGVVHVVVRVGRHVVLHAVPDEGFNTLAQHHAELGATPVDAAVPRAR